MAGRPAELQIFDGATMGTAYRVAMATPMPVDRGAIASGLAECIGEVDRQMSTWKAESPVSLFNGASPGDWFPVPFDLAYVVHEGLKLSLLSDGAFDMTVGALVDLWGFGPPGRQDPPDQGAIHAALGAVGHHNLEARLDPPALRKLSDCRIDLSGIAKGYGVDRLAQFLEHNGIRDYLVNIDGEARVAGRKPGPDGVWQLAVEAPTAGVREAWDILSPKDCAVATSGDYRRFFAHDGQTYSHTIDGRSGRPVSDRLGSVTVAHKQCMMADAWATALLALGAQAGVALAQTHDVAALFLVRDSDGITDIMTGDFAVVIG